MNNFDSTQRVESDDLLMRAGECFMYLLWCETTMRDLVVLKDGGEDMCKRYSDAFGKAPHPRDFASNRLELGKLDFRKIKCKFLKHWPRRAEGEIEYVINRVVIWRNVLGHASVQPFREHLLYTPADSSWKNINKYMTCHKCRKYLKDCKCEHDRAEPHSLSIGHETLDTIYEDIKAIDVQCFYPTARILNVEYQGVAWPTNRRGNYEIKKNHRTNVGG